MISAAATLFCAAALAASTSTLTSPAAMTPAPTVELSREGGVFRLRAGFTVEASTETVWEVLTDYNGMERFVPSLRKSRVESRTADGAIVEQEGTARLFLFSKKVSLTLKVVERPPGRIEFSDVGRGEFEEYDGAWTLAPAAAAASKVSYELFAELKPSLIPRGIARRVLENAVRDQIAQVVAEIQRRAAKPR